MKLITLGPAGSNHEFVTLRYIDFHGLRDRATVTLATDFAHCADAVLKGTADFMVQCAVHPACTATMARYFDGLFAVDAFISPSRDLAIIQRNDAVQPRSLVVMRPTLDYIDASQWDHIEPVATVAEVTSGLVAGTYAAGLGYAAVAQSRPDILHVTQFIGTVDDAWIVYGRARVSGGKLLAWRDSPASRLYGQAAG
jgi:hypothetical protein